MNGDFLSMLCEAYDMPPARTVRYFEMVNKIIENYERYAKKTKQPPTLDGMKVLMGEFMADMTKLVASMSNPCAHGDHIYCSQKDCSCSHHKKK